jgi:hypothetical protein
MPKGQDRSRYEQLLSNASRTLYFAAEAAERAGDAGAKDDCLQCRSELSRLIEDSVNGRKQRHKKPSAVVS